MKKENILILFGGESNEYEVSLKSAANVISAFDTDIYNLITVGITKDGKWYLYEGDTEAIKNGEWINKIEYEAFISPSKKTKGIVVLKNNSYEIISVDACFPVLHGKNGEDGTVQGLLQLSGIPFVGGGVLSMAVAMDKKFSKIIFKNANIPTVPAVYTDEGYDIDTLKKELSFPVFVKPSNAGSSVGCHKVSQIDELEDAIKDALKTDSSVLIEKYINCREIELAVLGNEEPFVTIAGEITSDSGFYDYETKYINTNGVNIIIPAPISQNTYEQLKKYAEAAYKALGLNGIARVDFFIDRDTEQIYLNEINTIPGFTALSMYPILMEKHNISGNKLMNELIKFAKNRK